MSMTGTVIASLLIAIAVVVCFGAGQASGTVRWISAGGTDFSDHRWQYFTSVVDLSTWSGSAKAAWLAWRDACVKALRAVETEMIAVATKLQNCRNEIDRISEDGEVLHPATDMPAY